MFMALIFSLVAVPLALFYNLALGVKRHIEGQRWLARLHAALVGIVLGATVCTTYIVLVHLGG